MGELVLIPRDLAERVTEIANRNEQSAEGDRLAALLSSPAPSLSEDAARVVDATMQAIVDQCVKEKLFLGTVNAREVIRLHLDRALQSLSSQLAEMREERDNYRTLVEAKVVSVRDPDRDRLAAENERLRETTKDVLAHLVATHSLLTRSPKTAAPSDKMFDQMLLDYAASIERARAALASLEDHA